MHCDKKVCELYDTNTLETTHLEIRSLDYPTLTTLYIHFQPITYLLVWKSKKNIHHLLLNLLVVKGKVKLVGVAQLQQKLATKNT